MTDFARMVELLDLRVRYDDLVINGGFNLPWHARGVLTMDKAEWILDFAHIRNGTNERYAELIEVVTDYEVLALKEDKELQEAL